MQSKYAVCSSLRGEENETPTVAVLQATRSPDADAAFPTIAFIRVHRTAAVLMS